MVTKANVFARLSPSQKIDIIQVLQKRGHVVGYMGDGINDALALKVSDVGISVDTAVDVAKEAADIVLLEKSLLVLEEGILEGRKVFGNIIKYIRMGASSNFGNMFSVTGGSYFLPFVPMSPTADPRQQSSLRLFPVGIPTDKVDEEYLLKPRKWNIDNVKKFMIYIGPISSIFDYATFGLMWFIYRCSTHATRRRPCGAPVPDGVVCRVAPHPDAHRPHHPHQPHSVRPKFPQLAVVPGHHSGHGRRLLAALFADGALPGFCAPAGVLVALAGFVFALVLRPLPLCQNVVL